MKKVIVNSNTILQNIDSYDRKFDKYGIGKSFFDKLSFPDRKSVLGKKVIQVQLKEDTTRQSLETNIKGYANYLIQNGFPASFSTSTTSEYEIKIGTFTVRFLKPKKEQKSLPTEMQEKGAIFIFNRALKDNVEFKTWKDIINDKQTKEGLNDIFKSWGDVPERWVTSYFKQQEKLFKVIGKSGWDKIEYNEPKSVMNEIRELVKNITIDTKNIKYENWNPSDIWIVKDKDAILKELKGAAINSNHSQTLKELNDKLLQLMKDKRLIGVSLKKVPNNREHAKFIYVNYNPRKSILFNVSKKNVNVSVNLNLKFDMNIKDKMVESSSVKVGKYSLQIKSNAGSSKDSNLKFESGLEGSGGRGGKAPLDYVSDLMKDYKIGRLMNDWSKYPADQEAFLKMNSLERVFNTLKTNPNVTLGVNSYEEFHKSILALYADPDPNWHRVARTKIMEMMFIYQTTKLTRQQYNEFWKDLVYLSIKEGPKFAPHGKLY